MFPGEHAPDPPRGFASLSPFSSLMSLHPWAGSMKHFWQYMFSTHD